MSRITEYLRRTLDAFVRSRAGFGRSRDWAEFDEYADFLEGSLRAYQSERPGLLEDKDRLDWLEAASADQVNKVACSLWNMPAEFSWRAAIDQVRKRERQADGETDAESHTNPLIETLPTHPPGEHPGD